MAAKAKLERDLEEEDVVYHGSRQSLWLRELGCVLPACARVLQSSL